MRQLIVCTVAAVYDVRVQAYVLVYYYTDLRSIQLFSVLLLLLSFYGYCALQLKQNALLSITGTYFLCPVTNYYIISEDFYFNVHIYFFH